MKDVNCIGYVYNHFGILSPETFVRPNIPEITVLPWFDRTEKNLQAQAFVIIAPGAEKNEVIHMGLFSYPEKITHRSGRGEPIEETLLSRVLLDYGFYPQGMNYDFWYLRYLGGRMSVVPQK